MRWNRQGSHRSSPTRTSSSGRACGRLGAIDVPVIDATDLIIAKVLAGRPKDLDDATRLWRLHGATLDAGRIRETLRQLEEALAQSDLLPAFETIASRS